MLKNFIKSFYPTLSLEQNSKKRNASDFILLLFVMFLIATASFVFLYADMVDMVSNSNLLLKSILEGRFFEYYTYTLENSTSAFAANYDFPLYLIFAIWNLPFALIFHFEINGFVYLWFKLLVVICIVVCSCLMYKIYKLLDEEGNFTRGTFLLLMLSSPLVFLGEFIAGQYDCISMILILAGLYEYLKGKEKWSLLLFCLAVPIKTFAIFLFIPLLVYKEKNVLKILLKTACVFIIPIICKLLFRGDPAYTFLLGAQNKDATNLLMKASVRIFNIEVHVFLLLFLLICFVCYFCKYDRSKVLLIAAMVYTSFIIFIPIRSYWVFLAEPFLILLIATKPKLYKVNFLIHAIAVISGGVFFLYFHGIYNSNWMARSLGLIQIFNLPTVVKYGNFANFIDVHGWTAYMPLLRTIFIGSCIALLVINALDPKKLELSSEFAPRALSWIKSIVVAGMLCIMVFVEVFPCELPLIDTLNYAESKIRPYIDYNALAAEGVENSQQEQEVEDEIQVLPIPGKEDTPRDTGDAEEIDGPAAKYYSADIHSGSVIEQPFVVDSERTVSEVCFQCYNTYPSRWSRVRLSLSIVDADSNQVLTETVVGGALVSTGEIYVADFKEIKLSQGNYFIRIICLESPQDSPVTGAPIYMMCNLDDQTAEPAFINGQRMEYPVCVCVN